LNLEPHKITQKPKVGENRYNSWKVAVVPVKVGDIAAFVGMRANDFEWLFFPLLVLCDAPYVCVRFFIKFV